MRLLAATLAAAAALAGCADSRPRAPMSAGERLYLAKCTSCHAAWEPARYTAAEWKKNVDEMEADKKVTLTPEERAEILTYLTGSASGTPQGGSGSDSR